MITNNETKLTPFSIFINIRPYIKSTPTINRSPQKKANKRVFPIKFPQVILRNTSKEEQKVKMGAHRVNLIYHKTRPVCFQMQENGKLKCTLPALSLDRPKQSFKEYMATIRKSPCNNRTTNQILPPKLNAVLKSRSNRSPNKLNHISCFLVKKI